MKFGIPLLLGLCLLLPAPLLAAGEGAVNQARSITAISSRSERANGQKEDWQPLNAKDVVYTGPVDDGFWISYAEDDATPEIASEHQLLALVQRMCFTQKNSLKIKLQGASAADVKKWLEFINTGVFGRFQLQGTGNDTTLLATYPSTSRIFAAFCNPDLEGMLTKREQKTLKICAEWICSNIQHRMPGGLKLKKVHDALVDNSTYTKGYHDASDVIVDGKGACSAYASATQLLLSMMRIDCRLVQGTRKMNHVWNLVKLVDDWYHLDTTWDDPISTPPCRMYDYFLLTDEEMAADHSWEAPETYPSTPQLNEAHFHKRNDLRKSWLTHPGAYVLPGENDGSPVRVAMRMLDSSALQGEKLHGAAEGKSDARAKNKRSRAINGTKSKTKANRAPQAKPTGKPDEKKFKCSTPADIDKALETRLNELNESAIILECDPGTTPPEMRRLLALCSLPKYAGKYSTVCNDEALSITITPKFWPHRRILAAASNDELLAKLTETERKALEICRQWAVEHGQPWKSSRQKIRGLHMALIHYFWHDAEQQRFLDAAVVEKRSDSWGYAQSMYVVCELMNIPCLLVHGRTASGYQVWNMVQVGPNKWFHADSSFDDMRGYKSEYQCKCLLRTDEEMRTTHAWDPAETPATPEKRKKPAK